MKADDDLSLLELEMPQHNRMTKIAARVAFAIGVGIAVALAAVVIAYVKVAVFRSDETSSISSASKSAATANSSPKIPSSSTNLLEAAVAPLIGTRAGWDKLKDEGGSNLHLSLFGLAVSNLQARYAGNGIVEYVTATASNSSNSAHQIRDALSKICQISDAAWEIKTGSYQAGTAAGKLCYAMYLPENDYNWRISYDVGRKQ